MAHDTAPAREHSPAWTRLGTLPIDPPGVPEAVEQGLVQLVPDPGRLPVAQAAPPGDAGAAAHFPGQHLPWDATLEDENDAGQRRPVWNTGSATRGAGWFGGKERLDNYPPFVGHEWLLHRHVLPPHYPELKGTLDKD